MKLRPITVMAVLMAVGVLIVGIVAWHHRSGSVAAGQPAELPIRGELAAAAAAAMAPASTIDGAVTYVAAAGLPALDGTARAWRLAPTAVTSATVKRLADALGLSGPVVAQGDGWMVAGPDLRSLTVSRSQPAGPWTWAMTGVAVSTPTTCAVPMATPTIGNDVPPRPDLPGSGSGGVCQAPVTTVPAVPSDPPPSAAQAETKARSILGDAGYDLSGWTVTATASSDTTQVRATADLDGAAVDSSGWGSASVGASLYFEPGGAVSSGSGSWAQPVQVDSYPLMGTAAGIAALNQGHGVPGLEPMVAASGQSAPVTATTAAGASSSPPGDPTTSECLPPNGVTQPCVIPIVPSPPPTLNCGSAEGVAGGPVPSCPSQIPSTTTSTSTTATAPPTVTAPVTVTMAPRQVRIDRAELVLEPMLGTDGATWLIPAYRFTSSTTPGTWTVLAIDTKWFDPGASTGTDTTDTIGTGGESSGSTPASSVVSPPASTVASPTITPTTTVAPIIMPPDRTVGPARSGPSAPTG